MLTLARYCFQTWKRVLVAECAAIELYRTDSGMERTTWLTPEIL